MVSWHETVAAKIGLRMGGLLLLGSAWLIGECLTPMRHAGEVTATEMLLAAAMVLAASLGCLLLIVGPGLFAQVTISERWAHRAPGPVPREMEPMLYGEFAGSPAGLDEQ